MGEAGTVHASYMPTKVSVKNTSTARDFNSIAAYLSSDHVPGLNHDLKNCTNHSDLHHLLELVLI